MVYPPPDENFPGRASCNLSLASQSGGYLRRPENGRTKTKRSKNDAANHHSFYQSHGHLVGSPQELRRPFMSQSCRTELPSVMRKHWKIRGIKENICNVA